MPFDVAIIGAGPAGSAAARLLAGWGHRVLLAHRAAGVALAESIPPSSRKLLAAVGVLDRVDGAGFYRSTGNTVWWGSDQPRRETFAAGEFGLQVDRAAFDALLRAAASDAGAGIVERAVRDVHLGTSAARVTLDGGEIVETPFVLDCSGRAGVVARRGWRVDEAGPVRTVAIAGVWRRDGGWPEVEPTHTLVESYGDGWAWSVPLSAQIRCFTAMVDPRRTQLARGCPSTGVYRAELQKTRHLARALGDAALERGPWGCDASVYTARRYADGPALLVGDAASFIDPLSSYGVKKALASAWLAAVAVHTALRTAAMRETALAFFSAREAEMAASLLQQTREQLGAAAGRHAHPFWTDRTAIVELPAGSEPDIHALRDDARVQRAFADLKASPSIALRAGRQLRIEPRPVVRGHQIVVEDRLFADGLPAGVRFLRDVDLAALLRLAPAHSQVPALFDAYNRSCPPVALPDFLGALSVMLAFDLLENGSASR